MSETTTEKNGSKERRGVIQTMFDPKTFPALIPVLLAVGSAFLTLDRMIQRMDFEQKTTTQLVTTHMMDDARRYEKVQQLKEDVAQLEQSKVYNERTLSELKMRVRALEADSYSDDPDDRSRSNPTK